MAESGIQLIPDTKETRLALQKCARENMKLRLLKDIQIDLIVCELEGFSKTEYLFDLAELVNSFINKTRGKR